MYFLVSEDPSNKRKLKKLTQFQKSYKSTTIVYKKEGFLKGRYIKRKGFLKGDAICIKKTNKTMIRKKGKQNSIIARQKKTYNRMKNSRIIWRKVK